MEHTSNASDLKSGEERAYEDSSFRSFFSFVFLCEDEFFFFFLYFCFLVTSKEVWGRRQLIEAYRITGIVARTRDAVPYRII